MATTLIWYGGPWAPCRIYRKASGSVRPYSLIGRPSTRSPDLHGSTRAARSARRVRGRSSIGRIKPDQGLALGHRHPADGGLGQVPDCGGLGELGEAQEGQAAGLRQQRADLQQCVARLPACFGLCGFTLLHRRATAGRPLGRGVATAAPTGRRCRRRPQLAHATVTLRTPRARALLASWWFDAEWCAGRDGGIGIRGRLKSVCPYGHAGSSPAPGTLRMSAPGCQGIHATLRPCTPVLLSIVRCCCPRLGSLDRERADSPEWGRRRRCACANCRSATG